MINKHKKLIILSLILLSLFLIHTYRNRPLVTSYTSKYHNFTLTFPADWHGKYKISEKENYLTVYLNTFGSIDLFTITNNLNDTLDSIPKVSKIQEINGTNYLIGGPTGIPYSDFTRSSIKNLYSKLHSEICDIVIEANG